MFRYFHLLLLLISANAAELTRVDQVRTLTLEQAREHHPVRLAGVVTYFDGQSGHAFIQDETGGVFFRPGKAGTPGAISVRPGDLIEISGITWGATFSPSIAGSASKGTGEGEPVAMKHLGKSALPESVRVPFNQLLTGRWHDQFVTVRATVRKVEAAPGSGPRSATYFISGPEGQMVEAWGSSLDPGEKTQWINREIEMRAIVSGGGDPMGRLRSVRLLIGDALWITPDDEALKAALEQLPQPFNGLLRYQPPISNAPRIRVDGTISLVKPGEGFFLTDGSAGLWVATPQYTAFQVGDIITAAGYVMAGGQGISDAIVRTLAHGSWPAARIATASQIRTEAYRNSLVSVEGTLRDFQESGGNVIVKMEDQQGVSVQANGKYSRENYQPGSRIIVTGVVRDGEILLRGPGDIALLEAAPLLTDTMRRAILIGSIIAVASGISWLVLLRLQISRQTRLIEAQVIHRTLSEERQRISRELHDSLEQHLVGLHLHIDTIRDRIADGPEPVRQLADNAARLLEHCREETRRSVFELRTQTLLREGLSAALENMAAETDCSAGQRVRVETSGPSARLDPATEFHLLRCAQEAVTNALKHAAAKEIHIELTHLTNQSRLRISDDGKGFSPTMPHTDSRPRFGLVHLRERAARIKASIVIDSAPGLGTTITLTVPSS